MKILNELRLKLDNPSWALDPELALIDTILNENPRLYEIVAPDIMELNKSSRVGRQDSPTVEQVARAALYKEMKKLDYRELEYGQEDSRICGAFIKLEGRTALSFEVLHKYICQIRGESLRALMEEIDRIMRREEGIEDGRSLRTDSTVVEADIHFFKISSFIKIQQAQATRRSRTGNIVHGQPTHVKLLSLIFQLYEVALLDHMLDSLPSGASIFQELCDGIFPHRVH